MSPPAGARTTEHATTIPIGNPAISAHWRTVIVGLVLALLATIVTLAAAPAPAADAQVEEGNCTLYVAGPLGMLIVTEPQNPAAWSVVTDPSPALLAWLGFSGSGASGGISDDGLTLYAAPGTQVKICIVDGVSQVMVYQGTTGAVGSWANAVYELYGTDAQGFLDCVANISTDMWVGPIYCYNFYSASLSTVTTSGLDVDFGTTTSTAVSNNAVPSEAMLPSDISDCIAQGSALAAAYLDWQQSYNLWQWALNTPGWPADPTPLQQTTEENLGAFSQLLGAAIDQLPGNLNLPVSDAQEAFELLSDYLFQTGDTSVSDAYNALAETLGLGADLGAVPTALNPGAVALVQWLTQACDLQQALNTASDYFSGTASSSDEPLTSDDVDSLEVLLAECATLDTTVTEALTDLAITVGQIEEYEALPPSDQDAATLLALIGTHEEQTAALTSSLTGLVNGLTFPLSSLDEILDVLDDYLWNASYFYGQQGAEDPDPELDDDDVSLLIGAISVAHEGSLSDLIQIAEVQAAVPAALAAQVEWATELCVLSTMLPEAQAFLNQLPGPGPDAPVAFVPLGCGENGGWVGLDVDPEIDADIRPLDDRGARGDVGRNDERPPNGLRVDATSKGGTLEIADPPRGESVVGTGAAATEEEAPPDDTIEDGPPPVGSCSQVKNLVQVDVVGMAYENLSAAYGWRGYDPATEFGPGLEVSGSGAYVDADDLTGGFGSAIVIQVLNETLFIGRWSSSFVETADEREIRQRLDELVAIDAIRYVTINGMKNIPLGDLIDYYEARVAAAIDATDINGITATEVSERTNFDSEGLAQPTGFRHMEAVELERRLPISYELTVFELRSFDEMELNVSYRTAYEIPADTLERPFGPDDNWFLTVAGAEAQGARAAYQFAMARKQYDIVKDDVGWLSTPHLVFEPWHTQKLVPLTYPICHVQSHAQQGNLEFERYWWLDLTREFARPWVSDLLTNYEYSYSSMQVCAEQDWIDPNELFALTPVWWDLGRFRELPPLTTTEMNEIFMQ